MTEAKDPGATDLFARLTAFAFDDPSAERPFSARLAQENGWTAEFAARALEEYRRFLYLAVTSGEAVVPSEVVDKVWHLHLIYTRSYWDDLCRGVLGKQLHHHPSSGGSSAKQDCQRGYQATLALYKRVFGAPPVAIWPDRRSRANPRDRRAAAAGGSARVPVPERPITLGEEFMSAGMRSASGHRVEPLAAFGALVSAAGGPVPPPAGEELRERLLADRLLVLRGFAPLLDRQAAADYAARWGAVLMGRSGAVFEIVERDGPASYMFTSGEAPLHFDGAFSGVLPWLQLLICQESPGPDAGGATVFCDTVRLWQDAPAERWAAWERVEVEYATPRLADRGGRVRLPLVGTHALTGHRVLRLHEPAGLSTVGMGIPEVVPCGVAPEQRAALMEDLVSRLHAPAYTYAHDWRAGDLIVSDNFALLHGRVAYRPRLPRLPRRLWRLHVLPAGGCE